jgi:hypothetical protein
MTLNQIISRIEQLVLSHRQLHHFYYGEVVNALDNGDINYPAVFMDVVRSSIDRDQRLHTYSVSLTVCDLVSVAANASGNEQDVQSDLALICEDLFAMLHYNGWQDWDVRMTAPIQYFRDRFVDEVGAAVMSFDVSTIYTADRCAVPSDYNFVGNQPDGIQYDPQYKDYRTWPYVYYGQGTEGQSITIASLVGATVLLLVKGDKIHTLTGVPPEPGQYTLDTATGLLTFGNDINEGEPILIIYRKS